LAPRLSQGFDNAPRFVRGTRSRIKSVNDILFVSESNNQEFCCFNCVPASSILDESPYITYACAME